MSDRLAEETLAIHNAEQRAPQDLVPNENIARENTAAVKPVAAAPVAVMPRQAGWLESAMTANFDDATLARKDILSLVASAVMVIGPLFGAWVSRM